MPETRREVRHQLRARLRWAGLGPLGQGVRVTPRADAVAAVRRILGDLGIESQSLSVTGRFGPVGDEHDVVRRAEVTAAA